MAYRNNKGFTIIEFMIALSIFTAVMVIVLAGVIFISRLYQQASNKVALEDASRNIHQQLSQSFQFTGAVPKDEVPPIDGNIDEQTNGLYSAICLGNFMYIYGAQEPVSSPTNYDNQQPGLYIKPNLNDCDIAEINPSVGDTRNLLPPDAKVTRFSVTTTGTISTVFAKSPTDLLDIPVAPPFGNVSCSVVVTGREFCATVILDSTVTRRILN